MEILVLFIQSLIMLKAMRYFLQYIMNNFLMFNVLVLLQSSFVRLSVPNLKKKNCLEVMRTMCFIDLRFVLRFYICAKVLILFSNIYIYGITCCGINYISQIYIYVKSECVFWNIYCNVHYAQLGRIEFVRGECFLASVLLYG